MRPARTVVGAIFFMVSPAQACDHTIILSNWKRCAIAPISETGGEADWASVPNWTKDRAIQPYFDNDPRMLANHGLCNAKYRRVVLCLPGWEESDDRDACRYLICSGLRASQSHSSSQAQAAGEIPYGSRAGQVVTITEMYGINTSEAVIKVRHTPDNAKEYCVNYLGHDGDDCIDRVLRETQVSDLIKGDCSAAQFVNLAGQNLTYAGPNFDFDAVKFAPEYKIFKKGAKTFLDGSMASGYGVNLEQFKALCPAKFAEAELGFARRPKFVGRWYVNDKNACREQDGAADGLLTYKAREFVGIDTNCQFKTVRAAGERYEVSMLCSSEGEDSTNREILEVKQNQLERTVLDGRKMIKFTYSRCPF